MQRVDSDSAGQYARQAEQYTGTRFRQLAENIDMMVVNTFYPCGPTFYGGQAKGQTARLVYRPCDDPELASQEGHKVRTGVPLDPTTPGDS
eukprot:7637205-Pyramimonas_sp.AAC.1